jgi:hypothetical protein
VDSRLQKALLLTNQSINNKFCFFAKHINKSSVFTNN